MLAERKTGKASAGNASKTGRNSRGQIIEAAARLFSEKGFSGATTKEIARAVGMSEANIFRYFANKDALYAAVFEEKGKGLNTGATLEKLRRLVAAGDDGAVFRELMRAVLKHYRRNRDLIRIIMSGTLEGSEIARNFAAAQLLPVREFLTQYIEERRRAGVFRQCNVKATVRALLAMPSQHAMISELFGIEGYEVSDAEAIDTFASAALAALGVSGRDKIKR
ncbi:MAG TPA: TetR/AcrR family transcriptional regulator [Pyrinomonadaceae bacterium]